MKTLMSFAAFLLFASSAGASPTSPSIEWVTFNGTGNPPKTVITPEVVQKAEGYPLGYVQGLIQRGQLCFRGDANEVFSKIIPKGLDSAGDESCKSNGVVNGSIVFEGCSQDSGATYSLTIHQCI